MSDENKIAVFRPVSEFPVAKREKPRCRCSEMRWSTGAAPNVFVDEAMRDLECRDCGARIDPFEYIWHLATEGDSLTRSVRVMREDIQSMKAQKALLEEQNRELRAEGRKLAKAPKQIQDAPPVDEAMRAKLIELKDQINA